MIRNMSLLLTLSFTWCNGESKNVVSLRNSTDDWTESA